METELNEEAKKKKYFSEAQINVATGLAGPIPAGIMFFRNLKAANRNKDAYLSLIVTLAFALALAILMVELPEETLDRIPDFVFISGYVLISAICYQLFLKEDINRIKAQGHKRASNWTVFGYGVIGIIVMLSLFVTVYSLKPPYPGKSIEVGDTQNRMYYDESMVSFEEVDVIAQELYEIGYFTDESVNSAEVSRIKGGVEITFVMDNSLWDNPTTQSVLEDFKNRLEMLLDKKVTLILEDWNFSGDRMIREI